MCIVFHVGYPKAASTTLQKNLFHDHSEMTNLGIYPTGNIGKDSEHSVSRNAPVLRDPRISQLYHALIQDDGIIFEKEKAILIWNALISDYQKDNHTTVLSHEGFLSARFANPELVEKGRRIYEVCPQAKILIILRSQVSMLTSLYRDHPFDPRTLSSQPKPVTFSKWLDIDLKTPRASLSNTLLFDRVIRVYEQIFSESQVLALPLELLQANREDFAKQLSLFLEVDFNETYQLLGKQSENLGITSVGNQYRRLRGHLMPYMKILKPARSILERVDQKVFGFVRSIGSTEKIQASEEDIEKIRGKFSKDNSSLAKKLNLPLDKFGYLT